MKKLLIVDKAAASEILAKAHVASYTRKDGTFVAEHDDKRMAAAKSPVHSDDAFDRIHAAGGQNVKTTSSGISYYHGGELKHLPHKEDARGDRYVNGEDLHSHLSAMKGPESSPAPKPAAKPRAAKKPAAPKFDHPHVVGRADKTYQFQYDDKTRKSTEKQVPPSEAHHIHFLGAEYGKKFVQGQSVHDDKPVQLFEHEESGHRVWLDDDGNVHADGSTEVKKLREAYAAHVAKQKPQPKPKAKPQPKGGDDERVHSDHAFDKIAAAGGTNVKTSLTGISYHHKGELKKLPHRDEKDGSRSVSKRELDEHLGAMGR